MKFGVIDFDLTVQSYWFDSWNKKALLNVGDAAEYYAVEKVLYSLNIDVSSIVRISLAELKTYKGEKLIVPLNIALDSYVGYNTVLSELSPDIIPVFLGMSFTDTALSLSQISCLKEFAPIGCRDERSYLLLKSLEIPCYLNGCLTATLKLNNQANDKYKGKIIFIDVPNSVSRYIPDKIKNEIVFFSQELYCKQEDFEKNRFPSDWFQEILEMYSSEPKLIVTSRFHGAVLALANDIPTIITLEKYTFRFSWLNNYFPIYTEDNYAEINWDFAKAKLDFSKIRELMLRIAKARVLNCVFWNSDSAKITQIQMNKSCVRENNTSNQTLYYEKVWGEIESKWDVACEYKYAFWGINDNSEKLYALISERYPYAELVSVYDMYKEISYHGFVSKKPTHLEEYKDDDSFFIIVTAYLASRVANDIFDLCEFPPDRSFLCTRQFMDEGCLFDI